MTDNPSKSVVTVEIAGEEYTLRADTTPDYARDCAAQVDRTIKEILQGSALIQTHKAAILAALSLTDQLFQARRESDALRAQMARLADRLTADVRARLEPSDLAAPR
jgi:cell division protein ZapA